MADTTRLVLTRKNAGELAQWIITSLMSDADYVNIAIVPTPTDDTVWLSVDSGTLIPAKTQDYYENGGK